MVSTQTCNCRNQHKFWWSNLTLNLLFIEHNKIEFLQRTVIFSCFCSSTLCSKFPHSKKYNIIKRKTCTVNTGNEIHTYFLQLQDQQTSSSDISMEQMTAGGKDYNIEDILYIKLTNSGIEFLVAYSEEEKCPDEWLHISTMNQDTRSCMHNFYTKVSLLKILCLHVDWKITIHIL